MITWDEALKKALAIYLHRDDYAYFYGAKHGVVLTDGVMDSLIAAEPGFWSKYNNAQIRAFKDYARGKKGYDCSGFVSDITGLNDWSGGLWERAYDKNTDIYQGVACSLLWLPGHVGIDIGLGYSLSFDAQGGTCNLRRHKENTIKWAGCGKLPGVDYTGADNR